MMRALPLLRIWLMLIALTGAAMLIGHVGGAGRLQRYEVALLLMLTLSKAVLLLRHYLEVKPGTPWSSGLISAMALLLAIVLGMGLFS